MNARMTYAQIHKQQPALTNALLSMGNAAASKLEASLVHLVKLRASQINGCAFCQHMHANEARKDGERQSRLDVMPAWKEVPVFSERERAALQWTETLTRLADQSVSEDQYAGVQAHFGAEEIVNLTALIISINGWNRIAVGFHFLPDIRDEV